MSIDVGEVIAVRGVKITLHIFEESNKETLFYEGKKLKGVSIQEHVGIRRGLREIVCIIEGEYLDERRTEDSSGGNNRYVRLVEARPIGYFEGDTFTEGIKHLPMIKDPAFLLSEDSVSSIYSPASDDGFVIGRTIKEDVEISLPWQRLFNSHIGIFGNTGSGKSNTLARLYTTLFERKRDAILGKSSFVIFDFNGEYTGGQLVAKEDKRVVELDTRSKDGLGKFPLTAKEFWDLETLSVLFQATAMTQRPFLNRMISGRMSYQGNPDSLSNYFKATFRRSFTSAAQKPETLDLLRTISRSLELLDLLHLLEDVSWHSTQNKFQVPSRPNFFFDPESTRYTEYFGSQVESSVIPDLDGFGELELRINLQMINDLLQGYVQFDHIQPLLKRVESGMRNLRKVVEISDVSAEETLVTVVSFRSCNQEVKKVLPLMIAKHYYYEHRDSVTYPPEHTLHLIIDEAHNILSEQSIRDQESWKDYRLETFEEMVKEGRKFGFFVTIASQRPADISPTVVSQVHNFLIHRLVNDRDLFLLDNTISTLDNLSKGLIPHLSQGACVVTGTSFDIPMVLQIDRLDENLQPDSADVDLEMLWSD